MTFYGIFHHNLLIGCSDSANIGIQDLSLVIFNYLSNCGSLGGLASALEVSNLLDTYTIVDFFNNSYSISVGDVNVGLLSRQQIILLA